MKPMRLPKWGQWLVLALIVVALAFAGACGPGNNPPTITSLTASPASVASGGSSTITCVATDPDGNTLTYTWTASGGNISGTGSTVTWIAPGVEGSFTISVTVDDGRGGTVTADYQITVAAPGSINITSVPVGATVYLNGVDTGVVTPYIITDLPAGNYTIKLTYYHYKDLVAMVTVYRDLITYIDWELDFAYETTAIIQPGPAVGKDSYVWSEWPVNNYGSEEWLCAGVEFVNELSRLYLEFDLSSIPATAVVTDADLGLYYCDTGSPVATLLGLYRVTSTWDEGTITWRDQPASVATAEDWATVPAEVTYDFIYWAVDDLVQGWVDGSIPNYGVMLRDTDETTAKAWKCFYSSDQVIQPSWAPKLVIAYFDPAP
jgi:hypothetical protein